MLPMPRCRATPRMPCRALLPCSASAAHEREALRCLDDAGILPDCRYVPPLAHRSRLADIQPEHLPCHGEPALRDEDAEPPEPPYRAGGERIVGLHGRRPHGGLHRREHGGHGGPERALSMSSPLPDSKGREVGSLAQAIADSVEEVTCDCSKRFEKKQKQEEPEKRF